MEQRPLFILESSCFLWRRERLNKSTRGMDSTVTRIRDFPSEGFTLNLLPKASPGERIWTQQSSGFKVTVTFYVPGRRWRMSPSFFLKLPSSLYRSQEHRKKKRPGWSRSQETWVVVLPLLVMSWVPISFFGHIPFQREKFRRLTSTLATSQG